MGDLISSEQARLIASQRKLKRRTCQVCGKEFETIGRGVYCSPACKTRAARLRGKAPTGVRRFPGVKMPDSLRGHLSQTEEPTTGTFGAPASVEHDQGGEGLGDEIERMIAQAELPFGERQLAKQLIREHARAVCRIIRESVEQDYDDD